MPFVYDNDKPNLKLPLVSISKELVDFIDIKNIQAQQKI